MTAKERGENTAPTSEFSWVKRAVLLVVWLCLLFVWFVCLFSILHFTYQEWKKSSTGLYFPMFCIS